MSAKRIIPCLDVFNGRVVKGVNFADLRDAGDPVELAKFYSEQGADEVVFLDISATHEGRDTMIEVVRRTAEAVTVPFAVGGGIRTIEDIERILEAGADKVSINSAAVRDKTLIKRAAEKFGSERIIVAVDAAKNDEGKYEVVISGGRVYTGLDPVDWAVESEKLGAGEILLTSKDTDGMKSGYDITLTKSVTDRVNIPVTLSGGCGSLEHFYEGFTEGGGSAALAATLFHFGELTIPQVKTYLRSRGIEVK
ncbi:MAG: imidazole glycerol phosphate synthase subunit HisF [Clostridiales bacterium]|nr:imidazole glycerol phosphate synthase subunit HisF [Clostridiales bacterium]